MRFKVFGFSIVAVSLLTAAIPVFSQVAPQAEEGRLPLSVGVGVSSYDVDWGHGRMLGGTFWADWYPNLHYSFLHGLGLELEARDISLNHSSTQPPNYREDTAGGGLIYSWRRHRNFHPYTKFLIDFGSMDFTLFGPNYASNYTHDTRTVYAPGGGLEYRIVKNVWARADYEYQFWPNFLGQTADPEGFTFGAAYDFGHPGRR